MKIKKNTSPRGPSIRGVHHGGASPPPRTLDSIYDLLSVPPETLSEHEIWRIHNALLDDHFVFRREDCINALDRMEEFANAAARVLVNVHAYAQGCENFVVAQIDGEMLRLCRELSLVKQRCPQLDSEAFEQSLRQILHQRLYTYQAAYVCGRVSNRDKLAEVRHIVGFTDIAVRNTQLGRITYREATRFLDQIREGVRKDSDTKNAFSLLLNNAI